MLHEKLAYTVAHRDIKTENILLDTIGGRPIVGDPGIAHIDGDGPRNGPKTGNDEALGPQRWRPPELTSGPGRKDSPASDIYMLGGVLYELLSGGKDFAVAVQPGGGYSHESPGYSLLELIGDPRTPHISMLLRQMFAFDPAARPRATQVAAGCRAIALWAPGRPDPAWRSAEQERDELLSQVRELHGIDWRDRAKEELGRDLQSLSDEIGINVFNQKGFTRKIGPNFNRIPLEVVISKHPDFEWASLHARVDYSFPTSQLFIEMRHVAIGRNQDGRELILGLRNDSSGQPIDIELLRETFAGDIVSRQELRQRIERELRELDESFDGWLRSHGR